MYITYILYIYIFILNIVDYKQCLRILTLAKCND